MRNKLSHHFNGLHSLGNWKGLLLTGHIQKAGNVDRCIDAICIIYKRGNLLRDNTFRPEIRAESSPRFSLSWLLLFMCRFEFFRQVVVQPEISSLSVCLLFVAQTVEWDDAKSTRDQTITITWYRCLRSVYFIRALKVFSTCRTLMKIYLQVFPKHIKQFDLYCILFLEVFRVSWIFSIENKTFSIRVCFVATRENRWKLKHSALCNVRAFVACKPSKVLRFSYIC